MWQKTALGAHWFHAPPGVRIAERDGGEAARRRGVARARAARQAAARAADPAVSRSVRALQGRFARLMALARGGAFLQPRHALDAPCLRAALALHRGNVAPRPLARGSRC